MKAVIMAGGEGSRLRPITCDLPKPMVPILGRPVMEYALELLKRYGIRDVAVTCHFLPDNIRDYFGDGSRWGMNLKYFVEEVPLGTAGSVRAAREFLDETFLVISGDALTDIDLDQAFETHRSKQAVVTLVLKAVDMPVDYGVVITEENGRIERFHEKPTWGDVFSDTVNTGIYIIEPEAMDRLKPGQKADFARDLFPKLMEENAPMYGHLAEGYWCDIGSPSQYAGAQFDILAGRVNVKLDLPEHQEGMFVASGVVVPHGAMLKPPCAIMSGTVLAEGCTVGPYAVIGRSCTLARGAKVEYSVLQDDVFVAPAGHIEHSIVCDGVSVGERAWLQEESVLGAGARVGSDSVIGRGVQLWPGIRVERHARVRASQRRGSRYPQSLFDENGITGVFNDDISAETIARLAMAVGSAHAPGSRFGVATWGDNVAALLRESFDSGLLSTGVCCVDMGQLALPVARFGTKRLRLDGAIHILANEGRITLTLFDGHGANIDQAQEKRIQETMVRGSFRRAQGSDIPEMIDISGIALFYEQELYGGIKPYVRESTIGIYGVDGEMKRHTERILAALGFRCNLCDVKQTTKEAATQLVQDGATFGLYLSPAGGDFAFLDENGSLYAGDRLAVLLVMVAMDRNIVAGTVPLPVTAGLGFDSFAGSRGASVERTPAGRGEWLRKACYANDERMCHLLHDGAYASFLLADTLTAESAMLSQYAARIPETFSREELVECPLDRRGAAMKALHDQYGAATRYGGTLIEDRDTRVFVWPDKQSSHLRMRTEAYNQEVADELALNWVDVLREIATNREVDRE